VVHRYGELGHPRVRFRLLLRLRWSEEGALHARKFYRTASDEFASTRPPTAGVTWWGWRGSPPASSAARRRMAEPARCLSFPDRSFQNPL